MNLEELVEKLRGLTDPDRLLDASIAQVVGYRKEVQLGDEGKGERRRQVIWFAPGSDQPNRIPFFTSSLDAAYELAQTVFPDHAAAFSVDKGKNASAVLENDRIVHGTSPAIALCLATLTLKLERDGNISFSGA